MEDAGQYRIKCVNRVGATVKDSNLLNFTQSYSILLNFTQLYSNLFFQPLWPLSLSLQPLPHHSTMSLLNWALHQALRLW